MALLLEFRHPATGCALAFVDDGRVGYAYLRDPDGAIIGDVWLYNRQPAPADVYLRDELLGRLSPGSQPGWAALARADSPLAQRLANDEARVSGTNRSRKRFSW